MASRAKSVASPAGEEAGADLLLLLLLLVRSRFGGVKHRSLNYFVADPIKGFLNLKEEFVETGLDHVCNRAGLEVAEQRARCARRFRADARTGFGQDAAQQPLEPGATE